MTDREIISAIKKAVPLEEYKSAEMPPSLEHLSCYYDEVDRVVGLNLTRIKKVTPAIMSLVGGLTGLRRLHIRSAEVQDITPLRNLRQLHMLDLGFNKIEDISPLRKLRRLERLDLGLNGILDIAPLQDLSSLEHLVLNNNRIRDISVLSGLTSLTELFCDANNIGDHSPLARLKELTVLWLQDAGITHLRFVESLIRLEDLNVAYNPIYDLSPVAGLKNLMALDASETRVRDFDCLAACSNLDILSLDKNGIKDLSFVAGLTALEDLYVAENEITDISPLRNLRKLETLDLRRNRITELPSWIVEGTMDISYADELLPGVRLLDNPLVTPPPEVVNKGKEFLQAWYSERKVYINEVKVLLVGNGNAGKTSLVKCLMGGQADPEELATPNIKITSHKITYKRKEVKLHFWDFGGQEVMHSTHQFFLSRRSIYILVLDGRRDEDAEYWLKHIESFGGNSPTLVVLNKMDANPGYEVDRRFLLHKYPFVVGFYKTACLGATVGIDQLKKGLEQAMDEVELLSSPWPHTWVPVKEALEGMKEDFISQGRYSELCEKNGVMEEETRENLAGFLNDLGVIVHFKNDLRLRDLHILQPRWVSRAAYKIINSEKVAKNHGLLKVEWMDELMRKEDGGDYDYQRATFPYILDVMKKFELCYAVREDREFLIPELMDVQQPALPEHAGPVLRMYFQYQELLPRSIMARFIVRMHEDIKDNLRWRTGVVLHVPVFRSTAIVIADIKEKRIHVSVSGEYRREHFAIIRKAFHGLHRDFERLPVSEWVPLPDEENYAVEYEELLGCEKAGDKQYKVYKIGKTYDVKSLLDGIEPESIRRGDFRWDVFLSYSSKDAEIVEEFAAILKQRGVTYWLDKEQLKPGDSIIDVITDGAQNSRYMIPCISRNQLQSSWSRKEYQSILHRIISGTEKRRVIPVILDDISADEVPLFLGDLKCIRYQHKQDLQQLLGFFQSDR